MKKEGTPVIFELGLNHMGNEDRAFRMVNELKSQGARKITIQVLTDIASLTRNTATINSLKNYCLSFNQNLKVIKYAASRGLMVGATVLDPAMVDTLISAGVKFFKVLSGDLTFNLLINKLSTTGLPVYLSTGASTIAEIAKAIEEWRVNVTNNGLLHLIHTVLVVPTPPELLNLRNISELSNLFGLPVAYGQHSDIAIAIELAIAAGAQEIFVYVAEKKHPELPDGPNAIECSQASTLIKRVQTSIKMMGCSERVISVQEANARTSARRSIIAARKIDKDQILNEEDIDFKRPRTGLDCWDLPLILGKKTHKTFDLGEDLTMLK